MRSIPMAKSSVSNRVLYIVAMNHAVNDGSVYVLSSLFPVVLSVFSLTVFQVGVLVALGYLVGVLCQPVFGHFSEGRDPAKFLALGILIVAVSIVSFIFAAGFQGLVASVILLRVGSSFFHPVGISTVSKTYTGSGLQRAMGFQSSFGNLGVLLVFLTSAPLYLEFGWKSTFLVFGVVAALDVLITLTVLKGPVRSPPPNPRPEQNSSGYYSDRRFGISIPVFFALAAFISGGSYAVILNFANIFLGGRAQLDVSISNLVVSAFIAAAFLGALSTGLWSRFLNTGVNLALSYAVGSLALTAFTVLSSNVGVAVIALLTTGFMLSATYPLTYTELSNYLVDRRRDAGRSFGILSSAQTVGASVLGLVCGYLSTLISLYASFALVSGLMLLGFLTSILWSRRSVSGTEAVSRIVPESRSETKLAE